MEKFTWSKSATATMGANSTKLGGNNSDQDSGDRLKQFGYEQATMAIVHHYIPPNLPIMPLYTNAYVADCNKTWKYILSSSTDRMKDFGKPGIVLFYDEFFFRLFQRDSSFEEVFPSLKRRGEILIKAITVMLKSSTEDKARLISKIRYLGHRHRYFPKIRPYQFATYAATAIEVIMYWLGEFATPDVAEAWSNVMCFFMKHMLESFLAGRVDPTESYQNSTLEALREINDLESTDERASSRSRGYTPNNTSARSADKSSAR